MLTAMLVARQIYEFRNYRHIGRLMEYEKA